MSDCMGGKIQGLRKLVRGWPNHGLAMSHWRVRRCKPRKDWSGNAGGSASLPGRSQVGSESSRQLSCGKLWVVEEHLQGYLVFAQWVAGQPKLTINKVVGKNSLLNLLPVCRILGAHFAKVVIAHNDPLIEEGIPD